MIKYKAVLFGSIGTIIETSDLQRKAFNQAFKKNDLNWVWTKKIYKILLNKSGGKDRISNYALQKKVSVDAERLRNLKTKIFYSLSFLLFLWLSLTAFYFLLDKT